MNVLLQRPRHLRDEAWAAIEAHRSRLETAITAADRSLLIGSAKELIESVARAVIESAGVAAPSNADFDAVVNAAHVALERQPGRNVSMSDDVRAIAQSAKTIAFRVRELRNDYGTGHGRGQLERIDDEKATIVVDAATLWCRWALRRLEHVLAAAAPTLINALRSETLR